MSYCHKLLKTEDKGEWSLNISILMYIKILIGIITPIYNFLIDINTYINNKYLKI